MGLLLLTILAIQPPFAQSVAPVTATELPYSWRPWLPCRARPAPPPARELLGLRRPRAHRDVDRAQEHGSRPDQGFPPSLPGRVPDPPDALRRRLPRERRPLDGRRQHVGLQLPLRLGHEPLVGARVREGDRRQPGREPVPERIPRAAAGGARIPRPLQLPTPGWPCAEGSSFALSSRSAGSGAAAGPAARTTSTSRRPAASSFL